MGVRTIFNVLGPLTNPANAPNQVLGVFSEQLLEPLAQVTDLGPSAMETLGQFGVLATVENGIGQGF